MFKKILNRSKNYADDDELQKHWGTKNEENSSTRINAKV